jgi:hypothetical protein
MSPSCTYTLPLAESYATPSTKEPIGMVAITAFVEPAMTKTLFPLVTTEHQTGIINVENNLYHHITTSNCLSYDPLFALGI